MPPLDQVAYSLWVSAGAYNWVPIAIISLLISLFVVALAYMIGRGFQIKEAEAWATIELKEVMISAFVAGNILFFLALINSLITFISPGATDYFQVANRFLDGLVWTGDVDGNPGVDRLSLTQIYLKLVEIDYLISRISGFNYNAIFTLAIISRFISESPRAGLVPLHNATNFAISSITAVSLLLVAEKTLLKFIQLTALAYILPLGIVLRTFPFTRRIGGALIAIAIGSYAIFPLSILLAQQVYLATPPVVIPSVYDAGPPPDMGNVCSVWMASFTAIGEEIWAAILCPPREVCPGPCIPYPVCKVLVMLWYLYTHTGYAYRLYGSLKSYAFVNPDLYYEPLVNSVLPAVAQEVMITTIMVVMSTILTVVFIRAISGALGGEVRLYGLARLI